MRKISHQAPSKTLLLPPFSCWLPTQTNIKAPLKALFPLPYSPIPEDQLHPRVKAQLKKPRQSGQVPGDQGSGRMSSFSPPLFMSTLPSFPAHITPRFLPKDFSALCTCNCQLYNCLLAAQLLHKCPTLLLPTGNLPKG